MSIIVPGKFEDITDSDVFTVNCTVLITYTGNIIRVTVYCKVILGDESSHKTFLKIYVIRLFKQLCKFKYFIM